MVEEFSVVSFLIKFSQRTSEISVSTAICYMNAYYAGLGPEAGFSQTFIYREASH
jgi:hypothetical protein